MKNQNHNWWQSFIIAGLLCIAFSLPAAASYLPFNTSVNMNIGIGTSTPQSAFAVVNGNVGIGTWTAAGGNLIIKGGGNVGIGSVWPGQALDVQGTVRAIGLTMSGQTPISGYVLTASDSAGDTTWSSLGTTGGWTVSGNNVYETGSGNVGIGSTNPGQKFDVQGTVRNIGEIVNGNIGIGTSFTNNGTFALSVMNGNVGIGTWKPAGKLDVEGTLSTVIFGGNVGIGSTAPGQALDVNGTVRFLSGIEEGGAVASAANTIAMGNLNGGGTIISS